MTKLINKIIILFILISTPIFFINIVAFNMIKNSSFKVPIEKNVLILGDSHTEFAINDRIIRNCINVSSSAEAYLYSYIKLKKFTENNLQIDTVLLSFHFKSLSKKLDSWVFEPKYVLGRMSPYLPFISKREWEIIILPNILPFLKNATIQNLKFIIKNTMNTNITFRNLNIGSYKKLYKMNLDKDVIKKKKSKEACLGISESQIEYLNKIIKYCKDKDIRLILISTPIYEAKSFYNTNETYKYYENNLIHIDFIDNTCNKIPKNGFSDISHLNANGSEIYSKQLKLFLDKYLKPPK